MSLISKIILLLTSLIILLLGYLISTEIEFTPKFIELPLESKAKCLDGSPYKFMYIKGRDSGIKNFLLYFEGGSWCGTDVKPKPTIESCRQRALTNLGKNTFGINLKVIFSRFTRFFSNKEKYNPSFYNWNKIFIKYCDGLGHISNTNSYGLYFNGLNNTLGVLNYLKKNFDFEKAENVVISGYSAGGLAALIYSNFINNLTIKKNNTIVIADSGFVNLIDYDKIKEGEDDIRFVFKNVMKYSGNNDIILKTICKYYNNPEEKYLCMLPEGYIEQIKLPVLIIQNSFDAWKMRHILKESCFLTYKFLKGCNEKQKDNIIKYGEKLNKRIEEHFKVRDNFSFWINKLLGHTLTIFNYKIYGDKYKINNITLGDFIKEWVDNNLYKNKKKHVYYTNQNNSLIDDYKDIYWYTYILPF